MRARTVPRPMDPSPCAADPVDVSVVVVSFNTRELTCACIETVLRETRRHTFEIIVVDNDSRDGSVEAVRERFPEVTVIANRDNTGFARANNQGFEVARGRFVLLLNSDTEVWDDAIGRSIDYAQAHADAGVVGCRAIQPDGRQQSTMFRYLRLWEVALNCLVPHRLMRRSRLLGHSRYVGADLDEVQDVEVAAGCFMLVRREVIERVGGMDGAFFMYGEEAEWCHRIRRGGWRVRYFPGARILHYGGASASQDPATMKVAMARSQILFLRKTRGRVVAYLANLLMLARDLPRVALWALLSPAPRSGLRASMAPAVSRLPFHLRTLFCMGERA